MNATRVAVVGGGISGLVAAYRLRALLGPGATITLVEQAGLLGGKLRTVELAGKLYDVGAEAFLHRRAEAADLVAELGLADELVHPTGAPSTILAGGQVRPVPPRTLMGVPASAEAVRDVLSEEALSRVAAEPGLPPIALGGEDVLVGELLRERFGPEVADRLVGPLLGGVYAGRADALSLRATMPQLAEALDAGEGSLLAAAARAVPAPVKTASGPRPPIFGALRGGMAALVDKLAEAAKADVRLGLPVRGLAKTAEGWRLEIGTAAQPEHLDVDGVVLAVPAPSARKLLADAVPAAAEGFGRIEVASMAVVALALPAGTELPERSGVLLAEGERHASGTPYTAKAFTFSSRKWAHLGTDPLLVRGSVGRHGDVESLQRPDEELVAAVRADLAELTGVTAEPVDTSVTRWGGGLPQYGLGHLDLVAGVERAVEAAPGLAVAGAALHGVGIPACITTGDEAAQRVAAHVLGRVS